MRRFSFIVVAFFLLPSVVFASKVPMEKLYYDFVKGVYLAEKGYYPQAAYVLKKVVSEAPEFRAPRIELIKLFMASGRWELAWRESKDAAQRFPKDSEIQLLLGKSSLIVGRLRDAEEALKKAVKLSKNKNAYALLVEVLLRESKFVEVKKHAEEMIKEFPDSPLGYYYLGKYYLIAMARDEAERYFKKAVSISPYFSSPYRELGELYLSEGNLERAKWAYEKLLKLNPHNPGAMENLLKIYLRLKENKKAEGILKRIRALFGPNEELDRKLALVYMENKEYSKAEAMLKEILKNNPDDDNARFYLGMVLLEEGKTSEAIDQYLKISPDSDIFDESRANLVVMLYKMGKKEDAKKFLVLSLKRKPYSRRLLLLLSEFYQDEGNLKEALKTLNLLLEKNPNDVEIMYKKGMVLERMGRVDEAISVMREILKLDPDNPSALNFIGYSYAERGKNLKEAKELIERALKKRPNDGYIMDSMGWVYYMMGDYTKALEWIKKALYSMPKDPVINEHMGDVLVKLGKFSEALKYYEGSLSGFKKRGQGEDVKRVERKIMEIKGEEEPPGGIMEGTYLILNTLEVFFHGGVEV